MKVYLDICCLKRSFDDQSQPRIAIESAAVVAILTAAERGQLEFLHSAAHYAENATDTDAERRTAVSEWLAAGPPPTEATNNVRSRFAEFRNASIGPLDALHLAWAEELGADVLLTTDDRFISRASRLTTIRVRVLNPTSFVQELKQ
jgi:predicted nucleic acid-binding protein